MENILCKVVRKARQLRSRNQQRPEFLPNVFQKTYAQKVLVSYLVAPFLDGVRHTHTNFRECFTACELFDELGYQVDVVNFDSTKSLDLSHYKVVYGFGEPMERSVDAHLRAKHIVYGTGCDTVYSNKMSLLRVQAFFQQSGLLCLRSARVAPQSWRKQIVFSDRIIALGNNFVKSTYQQQTLADVKSLDLFFTDTGEIDLHGKDFAAAKNNFVWWGSAGAVHKGLDLLLDFFAGRPKLTLHICGYHREMPFDEHLQQMVASNANIKNLGFINIGSETYVNLLRTCGFTIYPSVSEGSAPGIINLVCAAGLVPVISASCGLDLPNNDLLIEELTLDGVTAAVDRVLGLEAAEMRDLSYGLRQQFRQKYSYERYRTRLKSMITAVVPS